MKKTCAAYRLKKMGKKITDTRLREVARAAGGRVVKQMQEKLDVTLPDDALKCEYAGTESDNCGEGRL